MEPLSRHLPSSDRLLTVFYVVLAWIPVVYALVSLSLQSSFESLSPIFFFLLFRAVFFALLQATLTIATLAIFSFALGYAESVIGFRTTTKKLFGFAGLFFFSLSPTFVALAILNSFTHITAKIPSGLGLIVLCHFLMNFGFVGLHFLQRLDRFRSASSLELLPWLQSVGARRAHLVKFYVGPLFKNDFYIWAPQIFLWCFSSFAPVILLGKAPAQSTPEVLLYYSILNDSGGARILCIFAVSIILAVAVNFLARRSLPIEESEGWSQQNPFKKYPSVLLAVFVLVCFIPLLANLLPALSAPGELMNNVLLTKSFYGPVFGSLFMSALTFALAMVMGLVCTLSERSSPIILFSNFLSAPFILLGWMEYGIQSGSGSPAFFKVALGGFLSVFPWFYLQIKRQLSQIPRDWAPLGLSLGLSSHQYLRLILWPQILPSLTRLATILSLWTLGEYAFAKALFDHSATLPLYIEENLRRYNLAEASLGLMAALGITAVVLIVANYFRALRNLNHAGI